MYKSLLILIIIVFTCNTSQAYDTDENGRHTLSDAVVSLRGSHPHGAIHALQILAGEKPYPLIYGERGIPESTFTLPPKADGESYYYKDIQASFPEVNWLELERLYIPAGNYKYILLENLPIRDAENPLVITNSGGQVRVGGYGHYYLFVLGGGKNWILTGRYDPVSQTGAADFTGHWHGEYATSRDRYGFLIDDDQSGPSGLAIGSYATDFEIEFVEIREVGFAGMTIKTDKIGSATMENIKIHDNYVHDTLSEGFYIGSTQVQPQHLIRKMEIYNNRLIRTGTEAIQIGNLGGDVVVRNNVFALSATHWKDAFQPWQDGNLQLGNRTGDVDIENNIFIGAAGNIAFVSSNSVEGDDYPESSTVRFADNYFSDSRNLFFYLRNDEFDGVNYLLEGNIFTNWQFQRNELDPNAVPPGEIIRSFTPAPLRLVENVWDIELKLCNQLPDSGNGTNGNVSGTGNIKQPVADLEFMDINLPVGFDMKKIEVWTDNASMAVSQPHPVTYEKDDIVFYIGQPYVCSLETCPEEAVPPISPKIWEKQPYPNDDWRLSPNSAIQGIGLAY